MMFLIATLVLASGQTALAETGHDRPAVPRYRFHNHGASLTPQALGAIAARHEAALQRIEAFVGGGEEPKRIEYHLYPSFEAKGLATGNTTIVHADPGQAAIHAVVNDWIAGDDPRVDALLVIRLRMGRPTTTLLEVGLSTYFSPKWRGKGYEYWAARLNDATRVPSLTNMTDNSWLARASYLVTEPLAATFIEYLVEQYGRSALLEHYKTWRPSTDDIATMERGWHAYLDALSDRYAAEIDHDRASFPDVRGFLKGFCYAHEGYRIYDGYMSKKSDAALAKLSDLGTNSISITPFSFMRDPNKPVPLPFSNNAGSENDESVMHASHAAHALGMSVMLKPHIWLRRSWPGEIDMTSEADWDRFFDYYEDWIDHYAILAEMYHMEILCVGVELCKATLGHEARWHTMITGIRRLYSGKITYAANWGSEFESVTIWKDVDFIGVNSYYPLSDQEDPTPADLRAGADAMLRRIARVQDRYGMPVLFTEIGFTSTNAPWKNPHEPGWNKPVNLDHQALCYEAVFEALHGRSWCHGIYWWKWPSYLEYGGAGNPGFTPNSKPAEDIVRRWYHRPW